MTHLLIPILVIVLFGQAAHAGAWLREKGAGFMAVSFAGTYYLDTTTQSYHEYGLSDKTTIIADVTMTRPRYDVPGGVATVSLRRALSAENARAKWSYDFGVGAGWVGAEIRPHLRTGLSWGRGMTWGQKSGWMGVDGAIIWDLGQAVHLTKIDATFGANFTDVTTAMVQFYTAHINGAHSATLAPSLVFNPKQSSFRMKLGTESPLGRLESTALKLELWREF